MMTAKTTRITSSPSPWKTSRRVYDPTARPSHRYQENSCCAPACLPPVDETSLDESCYVVSYSARRCFFSCYCLWNSGCARRSEKWLSGYVWALPLCPLLSSLGNPSPAKDQSACHQCQPTSQEVSQHRGLQVDIDVRLHAQSGDRVVPTNRTPAVHLRPNSQPAQLSMAAHQLLKDDSAPRNR